MLKLVKQIKRWLKMRSMKRKIIKSTKRNFALIINQCIKESIKYDNGRLPLKYFGKILKRNRATRDIMPNNTSADLYDSMLINIYSVYYNIVKNQGGKDITIEEVKMIFKEATKSLKKKINKIVR